MAGSIPAASGRIFMSYRREETAYPAGWLYDRLADRFGGDQVFKDVDSIELGDDFVEVITRAVGACDVLLALIGREWLTITDARGRRRLKNPHDFVRLEIEAALTRNVRVIPILVDGASMPDVAELPKSLARLVRRQALELSPSRFASDTGRLLKVLERTLAEVRAEHDDAASMREPAEKVPAPSTTEVQEAPERREPAEPTPTPEVLPATSVKPPTARPTGEQSQPPAPSTTEVRERPERREQAQPRPTPSTPSAATATPAATRLSSDSGEPPEKRRQGPMRALARRYPSVRARIVAGAAVSVVLILVIAAIVSYFQTTPSSSTVTSSGTTASGGVTTTGVTFPNEREQALLGHIPAPLRDQCLRDKDAFERAIASVTCAASAGVSRIYYQAYETRVDMSDDYAGILDTANLNPGGGNCEQGRVGDRMYSRGISVNGRVACFYRKTDQSTWIVWSHNELQIIALAYRNDRNIKALAEWWPQAGPT